eukprot:3234907-Prorocentrum_lima.AAC.1
MKKIPTPPPTKQKTLERSWLPPHTHATPGLLGPPVLRTSGIADAAPTDARLCGGHSLHRGATTPALVVPAGASRPAH